MLNKAHNISVIAGDGIGPEVVEGAIKVLDLVAEKHELKLNWQEQDWGSDYYRKHGRMMPLDGIETLAKTEAIFFGAVGDPEISDVETLWGLLIPIRREFDQYINLRPVVSLKGIKSRLREDETVDVLLVRENTEGEYSTVGGRSHIGLPNEAAYQQAIFSRFGIERVSKYAFELAKTRKNKLISATKSNGIIHSMTYWDEVVSSVAEQYPQVEVQSLLIDALAAKAILNPTSLDVIVASNLFGDILADELAALVGSIGLAPSANLNPEKRYPSMFEPVHGSAPDIVGKQIANPIGQIWTGAMMLEHLGHEVAAAELIAAIKATVAQGILTPDVGGTESTSGVVSGIINNL